MIDPASPSRRMTRAIDEPINPMPMNAALSKSGAVISDP
jgi:hypothetical protein